MDDNIVPQPCMVAFTHEGTSLPICNLKLFFQCLESLGLHFRNPVTHVVHLEGAGASES